MLVQVIIDHQNLAYQSYDLRQPSFDLSYDTRGLLIICGPLVPIALRLRQPATFAHGFGLS
jgi:hypothetical protein